MQTTKHTPAPWQAYNASNGRILKTWSVCDKRGCRIAKIEEMPGQSGEEEMANARLIAAAPELLASLIAIKTQAEFSAATFPNAPGRGDFLAIARWAGEAMAKATA